MDKIQLLKSQISQISAKNCKFLCFSPLNLANLNFYPPGLIFLSHLKHGVVYENFSSVNVTIGSPACTTALNSTIFFSSTLRAIFLFSVWRWKKFSWCISASTNLPRAMCLQFYEWIFSTLEISHLYALKHFIWNPQHQKHTIFCWYICCKHNELLLSSCNKQ